VPDAGEVYSASFSPDGRHLLTVAQPMGRVQVWRASDGVPVPGADWAAFDEAAFRSNTQIVLVGAQSIVVRTLDGTAIATYPAGLRNPSGSEVSRDGTTLVVPTDTGATHVFTMTEAVVPRFPAWRLPGAVSAGQLSSDNRWFIGASWQRQFRVWAPATGEPVTPLHRMALLPLSASFSPDGTRFQVSGRGARRWDLVPETRPVAVLEKLATLFAGHELVGTELVPLPASRVEALSKDAELSAAIRSPDDRRWRWMVARQHLTRRNWDAANDALAILASDREAISEIHSAHGTALAELGRWHEAALAFGQSLARRADATDQIYYEALARASGGDATAIDRSCAESLRRFGETRNPDRAHWVAALCVLAGTLDRRAVGQLRELARVAAELEPDIERFVTVFAAAQLRAGDSAAAVALLREVLDRRAVRERGAETALVYALAQRASGDARGAAASSARFHASPLRVAMPWYRRFEARHWQRLLESSNTSPSRSFRESVDP
jgi:hypothetical protein